MKNIVGIINYGVAGNIHSIKKAVERAGGTVLIINDPKQFDEVDRFVIPGVGSFKDAMKELEEDGFIDLLKMNKKPILGICLGMQILAEVGYEYGQHLGLRLISGEVKPIQVKNKVPHVGFNTIEIVSSNVLMKGIEDEEFYFMHSYELVNYTNIVTLTEYSGHKFVSSIHLNNIYGVQFHPEKSREAGIKLFQNFIEL